VAPAVVATDVQTTETLLVPGPVSAVFALVDDLTVYPHWLRLVHEASAEETTMAVPSGDVADGVDVAWTVELRARIGPFARSKRLRMVRSVLEPNELVVFERRELDGRDHANWTLRAELASIDETLTELKMHLAYDGRLWTGGLLERALDEEIRQGRERLVQLISGATTR
jgi:hypothetical protein